jgi:hypothetical protein
MFRMELGLAGLADSDHGNILDSLDDPQIALGHDHSLPAHVCVGRAPSPADVEVDLADVDSLGLILLMLILLTPVFG